MANALYGLGREAFLGGSAQINWTTDTIKVALVKTAYSVAISTDQYYNPAISSNIVGTDQTLGSKTNTLGVANAGNATWTAVSGTAVSYLVIYKSTGTNTTSQLIAYIDTATGMPFTPSGGDVIVNWDTGANKIFAL